MKFSFYEVTFYLCLSTITPRSQFCCHIWTGAPAWYLSPCEFVPIFWLKNLSCNWSSSFRKFWSCCFLSFNWLFPKPNRRCFFYHAAFLFSWASSNLFLHHLRKVKWEDIFKLEASAVSSPNLLNRSSFKLTYASIIIGIRQASMFSVACAAAQAQNNSFWFVTKEWIFGVYDKVPRN